MYFFNNIFGIDLFKITFFTVSGQSSGVKAEKEVGALTRNRNTDAPIAFYLFIYVCVFVFFSFFVGGGDFN